jgi:rhodanese-related sulfurtransferase
MKKKLIYVFVGIIFFAGVAWASSVGGGYNYITAEALEKRIKQGPPIILIDICPVDRFAKGHIPGSIETNAYPSKTDEEKARLDKVMSKITASSDDVVIVCPSGAGGAKNTVDYYKSKGVAEKRLLILEKGMGGWPYEKESK